MQQNSVSTEINADSITIDKQYLSDKPSWNAHKISMATQTGPTVITYNTSISASQDCTFSAATGRMTATIAGRYYIFISGFGSNSGTVNQIFLRVNGVNKTRQYTDKSASYYGTEITVSYIVDLAVDDYVDAYLASGVLYGNLNGIFGGFMIGS